MAAAGVPTPASTLVFALLVVAAAFRPAVSSNPEAASLLSFKDAITSDPYGALSDWVPSDPNPCQWNGVTCKGGAVVSLALPKRSLAGLLSPDLGSLSSLRHLNLRDNQFHDLLPSGLFRATGLQSLALFGNLFSGPLPPEIGNLSSMQSLDLYRNSFNGSLPTSLLNCTRLKALRLAQNNFSGPLPAGFGNSLVALEKLDISHNGFSGSIPADIGNLSSLQETVDLSYNNFSGPIPPALGELPEKVYIDLSFNALSGPIPQRGALASRGPTAFMGNPALCGPPLKNLCSGVVPAEADGLQWTSAPAPGLRGDNGTGTANRRGGGMRTVVLVAIVAGDVLGLCLIAGVFFYCFRRAAAASSHTKLEHSGAPSTSIGKCSPDAASSDAAQPQSMRCLCFRKKEDTDDASSSDDGEGTELVPLDRDVNFDLDELLKASAFVLGKSGVGIVYKVVLDDGVTLAVRRLGDGGSQRLKEFQAEIEAVAKVRHPNVVRLRAYYWSVDEKLLIYDYVPNGSLSAAIHGNIGLPWLVRLNIMRGIARGLTYLHEFSPKKYVHGDLRPATILLGHNMEPFISDFGLPRLANIAGGAASPLVQSNRMAASEKTQQSHHSSQAVSPVNSTTTTSGRAPYQAPESFKALKPSQKWDVYSYGVLVLELITGRSPVVLVGELEMNLVQWVQLCVEEKKPMSMVFDPFLFREAEREEEMVLGLNIGLACANVDPERRPPMRNVLESLERWSVVG